ncbi:MAG: hypothetical protein H6738_20025 [Alphaproteobacteria bacterium]|nr:hypothetical protein [Alphaproteobacteria bacterium]MCB9699080.1 hypothetical protein [Alphaproteobacteria bacterium]
MPLAAWAAMALAHDAVGSYAVRPLFDDAGDLAGAWTTWGLVLDEGGAWQRVCHEALSDVRDAWLRSDGTVLLARSDGLHLTTDGGCTTAVGPITESVSLLLEAPDGLVAVVDDAGGDVLLRSVDGGASFAPLPALPSATDVRSAAFDGAGALVAAGLASGAPVLWTDDGGAWVERALPAPAGLLVATVHGPGLGASLVVSTASDDGTGALWMDDGAGGWTLAATLPLSPTGFGCAGGRCWVAVEQGVLLAIDTTTAPPWSVLTDEGPARCLWAHGSELWGCTEVSTADHLEVTTGTTWTGEMPRAAIVERTCPATTEAATICAPPAPDTAQTGDTGGPVATDGDDAGGCGGCDHGSPGAAWGLLLALAALRRATIPVVHQV